MFEKNGHFRLRLPTTNYLGVAEHLLMAHLGDLEWSAIEESIGCDITELRTREGREVYAAFFYIESKYQNNATLGLWNLDEEICYNIKVASFKNMMVDSRIHLKSSLNNNKFFDIQMCNLFITPKGDDNDLKIALPANGSFDALSTLEKSERPYSVVRDFEENGKLGLCPDNAPLLKQSETKITLNPDRDTNGAGLVYFANYFIYLNMALRHHLEYADLQKTPSPLHRKILYRGNASPNDTLKIVTESYPDGYIRQQIYREKDGGLAAYTETRLQ